VYILYFVCVCGVRIYRGIFLGWRESRLLRIKCSRACATSFFFPLWNRICYHFRFRLQEPSDLRLRSKNLINFVGIGKYFCSLHRNLRKYSNYISANKALCHNSLGLLTTTLNYIYFFMPFLHYTLHSIYFGQSTHLNKCV